MKSRIFIAIIFLFTVSISAQKLNVNLTSENGYQSTENKYKVDVNFKLDKLIDAIEANLLKHPELNKIQSSTNADGWGFAVGSQKEWFAINHTDDSYYKVPATCRGIGQNCYIFVEDAQWGSRVNQSSINAFIEAFDNKVPANNGKGIYQNDVETFGAPPDRDNDPRIVILLLDIKDGYTGSGGFVAGYFFSGDQYTKAQFASSNEAEIFYIDANPWDLTKEQDQENASSTLAHEFQHMIHYNYYQRQETFFNEAFSLGAEFINGFPIYSQYRYAGEPNHYLLDWRSDGANSIVLTDYSRGARFALYLYEQFGAEFFKKFLETRQFAEGAMDLALSRLGSSRRFYDIVQDFFIANVANKYNVNNKYGYAYSSKYNDLAIPRKFNFLNSKTGRLEGSVYNFGVEYYRFVGSKSYTVSFDKMGTNALMLKAIKIGPNNVEIEDVPAIEGQKVTLNSNQNELILAVMRITNRAATIGNPGPFSFGLNVEGDVSNTVFPFSYDDTEPTGVLPLADGDSVAVVFPGIPGARLDSVKLALRQTGTIRGVISNYSGVLRPNVSKGQLATFSINPTTRPESPYPIPWTNWFKVDLRSKNIDASKSFVVMLPVLGEYNGNGTGANRVMVTASPIPPNAISYTSATYTNGTAGNTWYHSTAGDDKIYTYLIKAYVSTGVTDVKEEILELLPETFALEQNYPNPFNPETTIRFSLPNSGNVSMKVYDILGKEVATLVNKEMESGVYSVRWDGKDNFGNGLASGIYVYSVQAEGVQISKKMILMK
ncbi:MAG: T9SS type A sorting domain-containing protein [Melioribacteraceae bacterium]|nr:T9SS type A sorting domain-containing protein [Melioribacteraceae bacterium]